MLVDEDQTAAEHISAFLSGTAFSASGLAVSGVLTMLIGIIFARWLGPDGFGIYSNVLVVVTFAGGLGAIGMDYTVARYVAYYLGSGDKPLVRSVIRYAARWGLLISAILGLATYVVLRGGLLNGTKLAGLTPFSTVILLTVPALALQTIILQAILALQAVRTRVVLEKILYPLLRLTLPFALLWCFREKIAAAVGSVLFSALVLTTIALTVLRTLLRDAPPAVAVPRALTREWSGYALPFVFYSIQNFIASGMGIDILLVGALASIRDSGIYAACFRFTLVLLLARAGMEYAFGPKVGRLFGKSDFGSIEKLYKTSSVIGLTWTLPLAVVLVIFSGPLITRFFGASYSQGATALAVLVAGFAADGAAGCNNTLLSMIGKPWLVLANGMAGGLVVITLCVLLIPRWGMSGAALAVTISRSISAGMGTFEIWRIYGLHPFSRSLEKPILGAAVAAVLGYVWRRQLLIPTTQSLLLLTAAIGLALSGYLLTLKLSRFSIGGY